MTVKSQSCVGYSHGSFSCKIKQLEALPTHILLNSKVLVQVTWFCIYSFYYPSISRLRALKNTYNKWLNLCQRVSYLQNRGNIVRKNKKDMPNSWLCTTHKTTKHAPWISTIPPPKPANANIARIHTYRVKHE